MKAAADVCALPPRWPRQRHSGNKGVELKSREKMVAHHLRRNVWRRLVFWWTRCFYCQTDFFGTWAFLISIKCHLGATGTLLSLVDWKTPRKVLLGRIHKHFANNGILMSTHLWLIKQCLNVSAPTAVWLGSFPRIEQVLLPCMPTLGIPAITVAIILSIRKDLYGTLNPATPL